jgi:hypothetical protein
MELSTNILNQMGFVRIPDNVTIVARFQSLNIYQIQGLVFNQASPTTPKTLTYHENNISFTFGNTVNEICRELAGDDFTDNEEKWQEEVAATPPYLAVLTKSPDEAICNQGYWLVIKDKIITHNCFSEPKKALDEYERETISSFITALSASLSGDQRPVLFIHIAREVFAETNLGRHLTDYRLSMSSEAYASNYFELDSITSTIQDAIKLSKSIHPKTGLFFNLAAKEKDFLKKFIYLFMVIEIHTHQTFKKLDPAKKLNPPHTFPMRISRTAETFSLDCQQEPKTLLQRFTFCSIFAWDTIHDTDIETFKSIKLARDKIYHGEPISEQSLPIYQTRALAIKIIRCHTQA